MDKFEKLKSSVVSFYDSEGDVSWLSTMVGNAAFYGAVIPTILDFEKGSNLESSIIGLWFVLLSLYSFVLMRRARSIKIANDFNLNGQEKETP
ncbi:hypothetical protein BH10PSE16_BH10PSE16_39270 [soil metagenome]